eukprot:408962-Lingulodinium_polyedra.AAC.1
MPLGKLRLPPCGGLLPSRNLIVHQGDMVCVGPPGDGARVRHLHSSNRGHHARWPLKPTLPVFPQEA